MKKIDFHLGEHDSGFSGIYEAENGKTVELPQGFHIVQGGYERLGNDLVLSDASNQKILIQSFFNETPSGINVDGNFISFDLAEKLAGPLNPGEYAQVGSATGIESIGLVETIDGVTTAIAPDGNSRTLGIGDPVFQGDIIRTDAGSSIGITFIDDSSFSLDENGEIVLDELVFDPETGEGAFTSNLTAGVFSFVSGQIAKANPDAMAITTPVATIGIRGTQGVIKQESGGQMEAALLEEPGGLTGELVLTNAGGTITLNQPNQYTAVLSFTSSPNEPVILNTVQISGSFGTRTIQVLNNTRKSATARKAQEKQAEAEAEEQAALEAETLANEAEAEAVALAAEAEAAAEAAALAEGAEAEALLAEAEALAAEAAAAEAAALAAAAEAEALALQAAEAAAAAQAAAAEAELIAAAQAAFENQVEQIQQQLDNQNNNQEQGDEPPQNEPEPGNEEDPEQPGEGPGEPPPEPGGPEEDILILDSAELDPLNEALLELIEALEPPPPPPPPPEGEPPPPDPDPEPEPPPPDPDPPPVDPTVFWTNGAGDGQWFTAENWSGGVVPQSGEDVQLDDIGSYVSFYGGTAVVGSLTSFIDFMMSGGALTIDEASLFDSGHNLYLSGGELGGNGDVVVAGNLNWTGGTLSGSGTMDVIGATTLGATSLTLNKDIILSSSILASGSQSLSGSGSLTIDNGTSWSLDGDSVGVSLINKGILASTTTTNTITGSVTNTGTINIHDALVVNNSGQILDTSSGTVSVNSGKTLTVSGGTIVLGSGTILSGAGNLTMSGSMIINLVSDFTFSNQVLTVDSGSVTMNGSGKFILDQDFNLDSSDDTFNVEVVNSATRTMTADSSAGNYVGNFNGGITNNGTFNFYSISAIAQINGNITNTGTIATTGNTNGTNTIVGSVTNTGTISAAVDDLSIVNSGETLDSSSGTLNVAASMMMTVTDGTTVFGNSTTLSGSGQLNLAGTHTLNIGSGYTHNTTSTDLQFDGAVTVSGSGSFTNNGAINLETTNDVFSVAVVNNSGKTLTVDAVAGNSYQTFNSGISNAGTLNMYSNSAIAQMTGTVVNTGIIQTTGNTNGSNIIIGSITNTGTVSAYLDNLDITNTGATFDNSSGTINADSSMVVTVTNGTTVFDSATSITGGGQVNLAGTHALNIGSGYTHSTTTTDLHFGGAVTVSGSGIFTNDGAINLESTNDTFSVAVKNNATRTMTIDAVAGNSHQTFSADLTNAGTLNMYSNSASSQITGNIVNTGTIATTGNTNGTNTIIGAITNTGTVNANLDNLEITNTSATFDNSSGTINVASSMVMTVTNGTTVFDSLTSLTGNGQLNLAGAHTLNIGSGYTHNTTSVDLHFGGAVTVSGSGNFINNGTINLETVDDTFSVAVTNNSSKIMTIDASAGNSTQTFNAGLTNAGTLNMYSDSAASQMVGTIVNSGIIATTGNTNGTNTIVGGITNTGTLSASADNLEITNTGTTLVSSAGSLLANTSMVMTITDGTTEFGTSTVLGGSGQINLAGTHTLNLTSNFTHSTTSVDLHFGGAVTVSGSGTFTNSGTIALETTNDSFSVAVTNGGTGTMTIDASAGNSTQTFNGGLTNAGTLNMYSDSAASQMVGTIINSGTIATTGNTNGTNTIVGGITNTGTINANLDNLEITNTSTTFDNTTGTLNAEAGMIMTVTGGTTVFSSSTTISGSGKIDLAGTHTLNIGSGYTHNTTTTDLHFGGAVTVSGSGAFTNNGTLALESTNDVFNVAVGNNAGKTLTIDSSAGNSTQTFNSTLNNAGTLNIYSDSAAAQITMSGSNQLTNTGTIATTGNTNGTNTIFGQTLNASAGTINVSADNLTISGYTSSHGTAAERANHVNDGTINVSTGLTLTMVGESFTNNGTINIIGAFLDTTGVDTYTNNGTVNTGASPGFGYVIGDFAQSDSGLIYSEIAGDTAGSGYDVLDVSGQMTLDGVLDLELLYGYLPTAGESYDVVRYNNVSGSFDTVDGLDIGNGLVFDVQTHADRVTVTSHAITDNGTAVGDILNGSAAQDILHGQAGDDTLYGGGGNDMLFGGNGDDQITVNSASFARIDGGEGNDTLLIDFDLDLTTLMGDQLERLEVIDITGTGANTLTLTADALKATIDGFNSLSNTNETLIIGRDQGDVVNFADNGWSISGLGINLDVDQDSSDESYTSYTNENGGVVYIEDVM